jgi:hypothetical protein
MYRKINLFKYIFLIFFFNLLFSDVYAFVVNKSSSGAELKWYDTNSVTYYINTSGGPYGSLSSTQEAMQTWTNVTTSCFNFVFGGTTTTMAFGINDGRNIITFGRLEDVETGTVGLNHMWYYVSSGQLIDCDIRFNTDYTWSTTGSVNAFDVQNIATHELGHTLSLEDLYGSADSAKTMYGHASSGETKKRTLHQDDIDGISY